MSRPILFDADGRAAFAPEQFCRAEVMKAVREVQAKNGLKVA